MHKPSSLSLSFLEKRPHSAADTLAQLPRVDAAGYLDAIPSRYVVLALGHMGQWTAASIVTQMLPEGAAAAVRNMEPVSAAATLRLVEKAKRIELLGLLPKSKRSELEAALSFPDDAVGAHMQTSIITVPYSATCDAAIAAFKGASELETNLIYIVDSDRMLRGVVKANMLLAASGQTHVIDIADPQIEALSSRSRIEAVASLAAWDDYSELPVLNRRKQLIGAITRKSLRHAIGLPVAENTDQSGSIFAGIAGAFITSALGVSAMLTDVDAKRTSLQGTSLPGAGE